MKLLVFAVLLAVANAQVVQNIAIKPSSERGYLEVTVVETSGVTNTGPVCGAADVGTAFVACQMSEWLTTIQYGTTSQLGVDAASNPIGRNLKCAGFAFGGSTAYNCTVDTSSGTLCTGNEVAAVSCYFTIGQVVGIAIGGLILCALLTALPFILCCICCCCGICCVANS